MKVRTLLAVTLATAAPAAGDGPHSHARTPTRTTIAADRPAAPVATAAPVVVASPRTLPTGSPACGNVQGKMSQHRAIETCLRAEANAAPVAAKASATLGAKPATARTATSTTVLAARLAPTTVPAPPRTLPSGAPACGNVQAKGTASQREVRAACLRAEAAKQQGTK